MGEVDTLKQLALDSVASLVRHLCFKLTNCKKKKGRKWFMTKIEKSADVSAASIQIVRETCEIFHKLLVEKIPPALVDDVTNMLLTSVDDWWQFEHNKGKRYAEKYKLEFENCRDILQEIVKSIIHPKVTRIGPLRNIVDCCDLFTFCEFRSEIIVPLLQVHLPILTNLKALDLCSKRTWRLSDIYIPEQLEEFSGYPDDQLLSRIITKCPGIKFLNIGDAIGITDKSIEPILKLNQLEKLKVVGTLILEVETFRLLLGLLKKQTLKELRVSIFLCKSYLEIICNLMTRNVAVSLYIYNRHVVSYEQFDLENL